VAGGIQRLVITPTVIQGEGKMTGINIAEISGLQDICDELFKVVTRDIHERPEVTGDRIIIIHLKVPVSQREVIPAVGVNLPPPNRILTELFPVPL
jgi:hypothetical protein